jgi:hypothetical protein
VYPPCPLDVPALVQRASPAPPLPATSGKTERDAWGEWPHELVSANFVVKWGDSGAVDEAEAAAFLDLFEAAWEVEVVELGQPPPLGAETWRFNVYLGGTGDRVPPTYGYAGYYTVDPDGWPMVVVDPATLAEGFASGTTAHEFYHAIQHATGSYQDDPDAGWWWEATAMWMEGEVWPDDTDEATFLFGYALAPHLPLWYDEAFEDGNLAEYHPYGAFVFARYLADVAGDPSLVTATWTDPAGATTPQAALAARVDLWAIFADFTAHDAWWDYPDRAVYEADVERYRGTFLSDPDYRAPVRFGGRGVAEDAIAGSGWMVVEQLAAAGHIWQWTLEGEDLVATLVADTPDGLVYVPFADGSVTRTAAAGEGATRVVVAAATAEPGPFEVVLSVEEVEDTGAADTGKVQEPQACGCAGGGRASGAGWVAAVVLLVRRRREERGRAG